MAGIKRGIGWQKYDLVAAGVVVGAVLGLGVAEAIGACATDMTGEPPAD